MSPEGETIFSQRYPQPDFEAMFEEIEPELDALKQTDQWQEWADHFRKLRESFVHIPMEDKMKNCPQFIELAKRLSLDHQIDMDIKQFDHCVAVTLYLTYCAYQGAAKDHFAELLKLADDVSFYPGLRKSVELTLFLTYSTHKCCRSGDGKA